MPALAQETATDGEAAQEQPKVWADKADLGFVWVTGNSPTSSLSFDNVLTGTWTRSVFSFRLGMYRQDRDVDAGIESRFIGHGGVGNAWADREDLEFNTTYGIAYTIREDEIEDPGVDRSYFGLRFGWDYLNELA